MHILNALEEESFETPPVFTNVERKKFFDFPLTILDTSESLRTPTNKACFLVMAGYFKTRLRPYNGLSYQKSCESFMTFE